MTPSRHVIHAAAIADSAGLCATPGCIVVEGDTVLAAGSPAAIGTVGEVHGSARLDQSLVIPALVNAHAHLDLSHLGPVPYTGDFLSWVELVRSHRAATDEAIARAVETGIRLARAGGTALIGDIAGVQSLVPLDVLRRSSMPGVSFLEVFGAGRRQDAAIEALERAVRTRAAEDDHVRLGLQPHAPYSCGLDVYRAAVDLHSRFGVPLTTHLAETLAELEFIDAATGPLADLLKRLGVWDDSIAGHGRHAIDVLADVLRGAPFIAAHLNYIDDAHIELLAGTPTTVAYCPRASAYFDHPHENRPAHRYQDMIDTGINVAMGTDSLLCLDTPDRISVLDDMRFLYARDGADPIRLLHMATTAGATALGFDPALFQLRPGPVAGLIAIEIDSTSDIDPLRQALMNDSPPRWVLEPAVA